MISVVKCFKYVKIQDIDLNRKPFSFSFPEFDQKLFDSISSIGLANPPTIVSVYVHQTGRQKKNANKYLVVSGLRRIMACKKSGMKHLPCFIIKEKEMDYEKFIRLNLNDNLCHRELNDIEKANLFILLNDEGVSVEKIVREYMHNLKLGKSRKIYEDILSLHSLDIRSKINVVEWNLPLKTSAALARYSKQDRVSVMNIAESLMPGINRLKEIMIFLEEIALIQKCPITNIVNKYLENIINSSKTNRKERAEKIRQKLRALRYPQLAKMERQWNKCVKELHLPREIKIIPPLSFEGKKIKLEMFFSTQDFKAGSLHKLHGILKSGSLAELISLVNTKN
jgi:hypothetical protein